MTTAPLGSPGPQSVFLEGEEEEKRFLRKCIYNYRTKENFCSSVCRNDQFRGQPVGSTTIGRVGTDEGRLESTLRHVPRHLKPKPSSVKKSPLHSQEIPVSNPETVLKQLKGTLDQAKNATTAEMSVLACRFLG